MLCKSCDNEIPKTHDLNCHKCEKQICKKCGDMDSKICNICSYALEQDNILNNKADENNESDDDDYPVIPYPPRAPRNNEGTIEYTPLTQGEDPQSLTMRRRRVTDDRSPTGQRVSAAQVAAANERWAEVERRSYCPSSCAISGGKKKSRRKKKKSRKRRKKRKSRKKRR